MIKITDKYYITADTNCYKLIEKSTIKDEDSKNYGQEVFKDIGYYTTIETCLKGFKKIVTREYCNKDTINSLKDLLGEIKRQDEFISKLNLNI